jgi:hypothetical protein
MDRENVIKGLECCTFILGKRKCDECPYEKDLSGKGCYQLQDDFHALLKEQETVEPSFKQDEKGIFVWCCGSCGAYMYHIYDGIDKAKEYAKFCRKCGKPVLWKGR